MALEVVTHYKGPIVEKLAAFPTAVGLAARLAVSHLVRSGIDPAPLLYRSGVSNTDLSSRRRIAVLSQIELLAQVSQATNDAGIGLTLAQNFDLREIGMLYYVAASSLTLGDGLRRIGRYAHVGNEALIIQVDKLTPYRIGLSYAGIPRHLDRHQMECLMFVLLRLCRELTGKQLVPLRVSFAHHRSSNLEKMHRVFGCDIEFDAFTDEMHFDPTSAAFPLLNADPFLNDIMTAMGEEALAIRSFNSGPFRTLVENTIAPLLPHAEANSKSVARRLGMSERTFARRLAEEDLTFGEILNELRRDIAIRYLKEDKLQSSQIAWLLGFQQPSSFSHACRRWTGKSPSELRA